MRRFWCAGCRAPIPVRRDDRGRIVILLSGCREIHPDLVPPDFPVYLQERNGEDGPWKTIVEHRDPAALGILTREEAKLASPLILRFDP